MAGHLPSTQVEATRQRTVLVVEDEILVRYSIAGFLRDAGYSVVEAANAAEAVAVFASRQPVDIVFTDVQMPGTMDGLMLARWVHAHHPSIPVLVTSGHGDAVRSAGLIPGEAFFSKPYVPEEVVTCIYSFLIESRD